MSFHTPGDLSFNSGFVEDPGTLAGDRGAASWLYLCGAEFAQMEGGMSYEQVQRAVPQAANVVSDPPRQMTMDLAREQIAVLQGLERPTLVTCRTGPRSSALVYLYAGLEQHASADEVLARAEQDEAPFTASDELKSWVRQGLTELESPA